MYVLYICSISWNDNAPRFSMSNNLADMGTSEGYMLQAFIGMFFKRLNKKFFVISFWSFIFTDKKKLDTKYIWAEDLWGTLDPATNQWNGIVLQVTEYSKVSINTAKYKLVAFFSLLLIETCLSYRRVITQSLVVVFKFGTFC